MFKKNEHYDTDFTELVISCRFAIRNLQVCIK
jgi:hypothetical protein